MLANGLSTMFSLARPACIQEKTLLAMSEKTLPAVSEEGLTKVFKKGLVAGACEWLVDYVQLSLSGLYSRKNAIGYVGKNLAGRVLGRLDDCVQEQSCCLCLRMACRLCSA